MCLLILAFLWTKLDIFIYILDNKVLMIDIRDKKIISVLQENARAPIRDIAKKTKLRPSTVHQRITKLKEVGAIEKFTIKLDDAAVDENLTVFMLVNTKQDLTKEFLNNKHVKEVYGITGEYDLIIKLKFADVEDFNRFVINLRKNPSIAKTLTMVSTVKVKD